MWPAILQTLRLISIASAGYFVNDVGDAVEKTANVTNARDKDGKFKPWFVILVFGLIFGIIFLMLAILKKLTGVKK